MANFHILESDIKDHKVRVVFHIAIPNEQNMATVDLQIALSEYRPAPGSVLQGLAQAEIDQINTGQLYEHDEWIKYNGHLSNAQKLTTISNRHTILSGSIVDRVRQVLKYWGYNA